MRISDVSRETHLPISTLRYYERRGILQPNRNVQGYREYSEQDMQWIAFVQRVLEIGMPLRDIEQYAQLRRHGDSTIVERLSMLDAQRAVLQEQLAHIQGEIAYLDSKISIYHDSLSKH
ncbi:transcriptional regulator [Bombiscardovia apis]|uniref:Transcriptional regulator n=1 Tax=Bombiscardovia apis TaxID=2932182 RepID=A0ABM8BEK2_9BIFI|nr:MerR family transcriptional regulator [Bombiscardovia apis]BDR55377.1 transcriptional regulator [Bombiscardovia apis]